MCRYVLKENTITIWSVPGFIQYLNPQIGEQKGQSLLGGHLKEQGSQKEEGEGAAFFLGNCRTVML